VLGRLDPRPGRPLEVLVLVAASAVATATRYFALKSWVFARGRASALDPVPR
jgi:hypothetical protein